MRSTQITFRALLIFLLYCSSVSSGEQTRKDGNWWLDKSELFRVAYVSGMFDGIDLGQYFILRNVDKNPVDPAISKVMGISGETEQRLMSHVTVGQVVAGLNDFYQDYRNRRIESIDAVKVVLEGTAGMPRDQLEKFIEQLRQMASKY